MKTQKEINLIAKERVIFRKKVFAKSMIFVVLLVFAFILGFFGISKILYKDLKIKNDKIVDKIGIFSDTDSLLASNTKLEEEMANCIKVQKEVNESKVKISVVLEKILPLVPKNVYVSKIGIDKGKSLKISFVVSNYADIIKLYDNLKKSKLFLNLEKLNIPMIKGKTEISYSLQLN